MIVSIYKDYLVASIFSEDMKVEVRLRLGRFGLFHDYCAVEVEMVNSVFDVMFKTQEVKKK